MPCIVKYVVIFIILYGHPIYLLATPTVEDFIREPDYRMAKISPSGRYLAEIWNRQTDNTRLVMVRDLQSPNRPIIGQFADKVVRAKSLSWATDDRILVTVDVPYKTRLVTKKAEKDQDFNIYDHAMFSRTIAINRDGSNPVVLLEDERHVRTNVNLSSISHFLPNDPKHVLMTAYRKGSLTLFKVNIYSGESERVMRGERRTYAFLADTEGKLLYRLDYKWRAKVIEIFEIVGDDWLLINKIKLEQDSNELIDKGELIGIYKDRLVYRKTSEVSGYDELWTYDKKSKKYEILVSLPDRDVLYPISDLRTDDIVGYAVDGDLIRYRFFDESAQLDYDKLAAKIGDYNFHYNSFSEDGSKVVVYQFGQDNPGSFSLYDRKAEKLEFLQHRHFSIAINNLSLPAQAWFTTRDGLKVKSYILLPKSYQKGKKYPMVVVPHSGPQARARADYDGFAQFLSTRGYIVLQPNFRGSTGYGKEFQEAGYKEWGGEMQEDLVDATNVMVKKGYVEAGKVCIVGISYGGYAALMGAIKNADIFRCAIGISSVTDLLDMIDYDMNKIEDRDLIDKYIYQRVGHPKIDYKKLVENSPARQAQEFKIPILIIAGDKDDIVPFKQAIKLKKALKKAKKEFEFLLVEDAGHNLFYYRDDAQVVFSKIEVFLAKHLGK